MSVVCQISFVHRSPQDIPPNEMVALKVYDCRFATAHWHFHIDEPCGEDLEEPYLKHLVDATLSEDEYKFSLKEIEQLIPNQIQQKKGSRE
jgi:hypothetical protein